MITAKISAMGQIGLPKEVREALGLSVGDRVAFAVERDTVALLPLRTRTVEALYGALSHLAKPRDVAELRARRAKDLAVKVLGDPLPEGAYVDANVVLRYLLREPVHQAAAARDLFAGRVTVGWCS